MGNIEGHDCPPVREDERQELALNREVDLSQYVQHIKGHIDEDCMKEFPWELRDSLCLYERINMSFNNIQEIPNELPLRLPHLSYLNLNHNNVRSLPESFGLLFHLKTFLICHNLLQSLPKSFTKLVKLETADLANNALENLPTDIGFMESLSKLNVSGNALTTLPLSIGLSTTIVLLISSGNNLHSPPQVLCDEGSDMTIAFIKKQCLERNLFEVNPQMDSSNEFPRIRGNQILSDVSNPQSAHVQYIQAQTHTTHTTSRIKTPLLPPLMSSRFQAGELSDKIVGLIYGAAIGDALGLCTKNMSNDEVRFHYNSELNYGDKVIDETRVLWKTGDWTDVFDQTVLVLDSILSWAGVVDELDFVRRLNAWVISGFPELGDESGMVSSPVTQKVLQNPKFLKDPHSAAMLFVENADIAKHHDVVNGNVMNAEVDRINRSSKETQNPPSLCEDNGALSRSIILGVPYFFKLSEVEANAVRICKATHAVPLCIASAVTLSTIVACMIQGAYNEEDPESIEAMIQAAGSRGKAYIKSKEDMAHFVEYLNVCDIRNARLREKSNSSHVLKALSSGLVVLRESTHQDFRRGLMSVINECGDSNHNACIAGALLGCRTGYRRLPKKWVAGLLPQQMDWLNCKINTLLDMMGIP